MSPSTAAAQPPPGLGALALPAALTTSRCTAVVLLGIGLGWSFAYVRPPPSSYCNGRKPGRARPGCSAPATLRSGLTGASLVVLAGYVFDPDGVEYVASSSPRVLLTRTLEAAELAGVARIRPPDSADLPRRSRLRRVSLALAALGGDFVASDGVQHT